MLRPRNNPEKAKLTPVLLAAYIAASGRPFDQTAGFRRWAKSRKLGKLTMIEWAALWDKFQTRPV